MSDKQQYEDVCKNEFERIRGSIEEVNKSLQEIHKALFVGNGQPAMRTQIEILKQGLGIVTWFGGAIAVAVIGSIVAMWFTK